MKNCDKFPHGGPGIQRIARDRIQKFPVPVVPAESHDGTKSMFHTGAAFFKKAAGGQQVFLTYLYGSARSGDVDRLCDY